MINYPLWDTRLVVPCFESLLGNVVFGEGTFFGQKRAHDDQHLCACNYISIQPYKTKILMTKSSAQPQTQPQPQPRIHPLSSHLCVKTNERSSLPLFTIIPYFKPSLKKTKQNKQQR